MGMGWGASYVDTEDLLRQTRNLQTDFGKNGYSPEFETLMTEIADQFHAADRSARMRKVTGGACPYQSARGIYRHLQADIKISNPDSPLLKIEI